MDAGLMLKFQAKTKFIPLRHQLPAEEIPPSLRGTLAPSIDDPDRDIHQLINDIHGVVKKPPLGKKPTIVTQGAQQSTGYSAAANAVAKVFVETTQHAFEYDPHLSLNELVSATGLPKDDVVDALHELSDFTVVRHEESLYPKTELFVQFDRFWQSWNPADDALRLAIDMMNDDQFPDSPEEIAKRYGWDSRRMNPALAYLVNRDLVYSVSFMDGLPWQVSVIRRTDATRRFVKGRT